jgi:hypothetical protein
LPESAIPSAEAGSDAEHDLSFQISTSWTVLLPESFRGGCSFGAGDCRSLPSLTLLTVRVLLKNHIATLYGNSRRFPLACVYRKIDVFLQRIRAMGIREHLIAPRSPWQNAYVERLIGAIRRECLDHMIVVGESAPAPDPTRICRLL